ncbi:hypothetical protein BSZ19_01075 [Bradyrhizobium japonicum]|uniref:Uncharacterized protein n=1 Tax=Bradyrhizobium japonicum TaxID=375 RepID=A0A1Y2JXX5_BRAJP|nr:hypothetical protein BSZ19_01075 [Bradyrhizobium japonicum]
MHIVDRWFDSQFVERFGADEAAAVAPIRHGGACADRPPHHGTAQARPTNVISSVFARPAGTHQRWRRSAFCFVTRAQVAGRQVPPGQHPAARRLLRQPPPLEGRRRGPREPPRRGRF